MTTLKDLQATLVLLIAGMDPFKGQTEHIYADDGNKQSAMETSLKAPGWCVVVSPPLRGSVFSQTKTLGSGSLPGLTLLDVLTVVSIRTNPKVNAGDNAVNVLEAASAMLRVLKAWTGGMGEPGFELNEEEALMLDGSDEGNFSYDISLRKRVAA
jgi:hypothetical protein